MNYYMGVSDLKALELFLAMNNPRRIFFNELISLKVDKLKAYSIALDAGSSQTIVDEEYLTNIKIPKDIITDVLQKVRYFYFGYYSNEEN